ncbi:TPA: hypothetical protein RS471_000239 [Pseudomonas aeruginosa]|uniref:hypothetical protein n=1 Tax=Ectopseudomonas guguanensis TaxID=1198456 RepID=UPI00286164BE|nr:hypothetical protein [Pseudomonas guguanensis]MDR8017796.1 hypothetical protein [Pseudomonas guguanensis]HDZ6667928.1 hypothetical protein [Pseudomonas aeruginosa]
MNVVTGLNETLIDGLLRSKASFEVVGLRGNFSAGIKLVETRIESLGMKCRVRSDLKSSLMQGGIMGGVLGAVSVPVSLTAVAIGAAAGMGHALATYDPDYEILKDYVNKKLRVVYKK